MQYPARIASWDKFKHILYIQKFAISIERNRDIACLDWCLSGTSFDEVTRIHRTCNCMCTVRNTHRTSAWGIYIDAHNYEGDVERSYSGRSGWVCVPPMYSKSVPEHNGLLWKITLYRKERGQFPTYSLPINIIPWLIVSVLSEFRVDEIRVRYLHRFYKLRKFAATNALLLRELLMTDVTLSRYNPYQFSLFCHCVAFFQSDGMQLFYVKIIPS